MSIETELLSRLLLEKTIKERVPRSSITFNSKWKKKLAKVIVDKELQFTTFTYGTGFNESDFEALMIKHPELFG